MFSASLINNGYQKIESDDYEHNPEDELCCPDPNCRANMIFIAETTEMATFNMPAYFRTKQGEKHISGCTAHQQEKDFKKKMDSIIEALQNNKKIVFSLNDIETLYGLPKNLGRTFNSRSDPAYAHTELYAFETENCGKIKSQSVKKIRTLVSMIHLIDRKLGLHALNNVYFAWQGQLVPYENLICQDKEQSHALARNLYVASRDTNNPYRFEKYEQVGAYGFPQMIEFTPSKTAKSGKKNMIFGDQYVLEQNGKKTLYLTHAIDLGRLDEDTKNRVLNGNSVRLIAVPKVNRTIVDRAVEDYQSGKSASIRITWTLTGGHQVQSLDPEKAMSIPLPSIIERKQLVLL
jgi:hypothetical protein